jgi:hypothetical protein
MLDRFEIRVRLERLDERAQRAENVLRAVTAIVAGVAGVVAGSRRLMETVSPQEIAKD